MKEEVILFEEWMDLYAHQFERFAFQNGCTQEQASRIVEDTFREIYNDQEISVLQMRNVYKIVLEKTAILPLTTPLLEDVFGFEEDAELHSAIIHLDEKYRVPLVLKVFHGMDYEQVAGLIGLPISEVEMEIRAARKLLGKAINESETESLEKRFELLGKSYARLPFHFNMENVWKSMISVSDPIEKNRKKRGSVAWLIAIVLSVLLVGLVGSTYFTGEDWELRADRKYIEGLKKEFAGIVTEKQTILGVSDAVFNRMTYLMDAQEHFNVLLMELEEKNQHGQKIDRQFAQAWFLEVIEAMKLPSEHADELFAAPLVNDAEQSMMFVEGYLMKVNMISYSLYELYGNDYDRLREAIQTGAFDAEAILTRQDGYSENTIEVIKALTSQNIGLLLPEEALGKSELVTQLRDALHESAGIRLTQYEREPFIMNEKLVYSLDETIGFIKEMEETLVLVRRNQWMGNYVVEGAMLNLLDAVLQGKTIEELKNNDGSISGVHRDAWKQLALLGPDSGVGTIMTKIVEEMEASGWKHSEFRDSLDNGRIHLAYSYASMDTLKQFGLDPFQVKVTYNEKIFKLPNNNLDRTVADLYDEFSVAYDRTILRNVHPLFIVGLYYYANVKDDSAMMWHLTDPASRKVSVEEYNVKEIALLDMTDSIRFNPSMIMDDGHKVLTPIEFERNGKVYYNVWMTYAEDEVWQIESIIIDEGSL